MRTFCSNWTALKWLLKLSSYKEAYVCRTNGFCFQTIASLLQRASREKADSELHVSNQLNSDTALIAKRCTYANLETVWRTFFLITDRWELASIAFISKHGLLHKPMNFSTSDQSCISANIYAQAIVIPMLCGYFSQLRAAKLKRRKTS